MPRVASIIAVWASVSACALFGGDDDNGDGPAGAVCTRAEECSTEQVCNLVTERCAPRNAAPPNSLRAEMVCPVGSGTGGGPAYYSWSFDERREDFGALCFATVLAEDLISLFAFGGGSEFAVSLELDPTRGTGTFSPPGDVLVYVDTRGDDSRSFAFGTSGTVVVEAVSSTEVRVTIDVALAAAIGPGEACADAPLRCGSAGAGWFCNLDEATPACRKTCFGGRSCPSSDRCEATPSGFDLCVPAVGQPGALCETNEDCVDGMCIEGQLGSPDERFCRALCHPDAAPYCGIGPEVCVPFTERSDGVCVPNACSLMSCAASRICKPTSVFEASCVSGGTIAGVFALRIRSAPTFDADVADAAGSVPGIGDWTSTGRGNARVIEVNDELFVSVVFEGTNGALLGMFVPRRFADPLDGNETIRPLVPRWEVEAQLFVDVGGELVAVSTAQSGSAVFTSLGTSVGAEISGAFDLAFDEAAR